jgi:hypothetical protein
MMAKKRQDGQHRPDYKRMSNIMSELLYGEALSTEKLEYKAKENGIEITKVEHKTKHDA